jgi:subtilisin-like proprotein convertase family protein
MSLFRLPKLANLTSRIDGFRGRRNRKERSTGKQHTKFRRLLLDPLEERQLLSLSPADLQDTLVNSLDRTWVPLTDETYVEPGTSQTYDRFQTRLGDPSTLPGQSVATDHDGDFVVTYTRYDELRQLRINPNGTVAKDGSGNPIYDPITDPVTGEDMVDANVYARYFTDEVQRITVPDAMVANTGVNDGMISLRYGGNAVQKLTISSTYEPYVGYSPVGITFTLQADLNHDGTYDAATPSISYNESNLISGTQTLDEVATEIQGALRGLHFDLADVVVQAVNSHEFLINFGDASAGRSQTPLYIDPTDPLFSLDSGFYPAIEVSTVRDPRDYTNIRVSATDPNQTANAIEQTINVGASNYLIGPVDFPPPDRIPSAVEGPYNAPELIRTSVPKVSVQAVLGLRDTDTQILTFDALTAAALNGQFQLKIGGVTTGAINFDSTNLTATASNIQSALLTAGFTTNVSVKASTDPFQFTVKFVGPSAGTSPALMQYIASDTPITANVTTAYGTMDGRVFDVTFVGESAKKDHPEMKLVAAVDAFNSSTDAYGTAYIAEPGVGVITLKQTSEEFRVNPEEPNDRFTPVPDKYQQTRPAVAMDADGDFVITWQSEVPNSVNFGSVTDVFARRFSPIGIQVDSSSIRGFVTPGVRAWVDDTQILTIDAFQPGALVGKFQLNINGSTTEPINFDSNRLTDVVAEITARLTDLGYPGVEVKILSGVGPYAFEIHFGGPSGGVDQPLIQYEPVLVNGQPSLSAAITIADKQGDLSTLRVNQFTTGRQYEPSVAMDDQGNFVISWTNEGQDLSYFHGITAQQFDRYGQRVDAEFMVNLEDTAHHEDSFVAMSADGNYVVTWTRTEDPGVVVPSGYVASVQAKVYGQQGTELASQFRVGGGGNSSASFDANNNWLVAWNVVDDTDSLNDLDQTGIRARMYNLAATTVLRDTFRANSPSDDPDSTTTWPLGQYSPSAVLDADGDLVIGYDGYGPDTSENTSSFNFGRPATPQEYQAFRDYLRRQINATTNSDLLAYFNPATEDLPDFFNGHGGNQPGEEGFSYIGSNGDVDGVIEDVLIHALNPGLAATPATAQQVGRLRAILEEAAGLLHGEANGILFSRWDTDPTLNSSMTVLYGDSVLNNTRDGHNSRYIVRLNGTLDWSAFTLRLSHPYVPGYVDIPVTVARPNNVIDLAATAQNINVALQTAGLAYVGRNWPEITYEGTVDVRVLSAIEIATREGTAWELTGVDAGDYVFEITFQGEVHDIPMFLAGVDGTLTGQEVQVLTISPDIGAATPMSGTYVLAVTNAQGQVQRVNVGFNSNNIAGAAANITGALAALGFANATVTPVPPVDPAGPWQFRILFAGNTNQPQVVYEDLLNPVTGAKGLAATGGIITTAQGGAADGPIPTVLDVCPGNMGTVQTDVSLGMEPDGDFVGVWTQWDEYSTGSISNNNIYYRRMDESTDTAGPMVSDVVGPVTSRPMYVDEGANLMVGPDGVRYLVLNFDEDMLTSGPDSVLNPANYRLLRSGVELRGAVIKAEYGLNKAAELSGAYGLSPIPENKWQVVLTLDGNGLEPGTPALLTGDYTIMALAPQAATVANPSGISGLRDRSGNPLGYTGFSPTGADFSRYFVIKATGQPDDNGQTPGGGGTDAGINGRTYPEAPGAIAVDGDGDHVRVWTAYDAASGHDRVYVGIYDASGELAVIQGSSTPAVQLLPFTVTDAVATNDQRYATVACDKDGDFVVTWTQYDDLFDAQGNLVIDPNTGMPKQEANIYARRFTASGLPEDGEFRVNTYTVNNQKWSNVAMDVDGDFVVTWSSYGQEDRNQLGYGYGVYARRYDSFGVPLAPEFRVNVTTAGDQQSSSVAVANDGGFVIAWTSDQDGVGDDIFYRVYDSNGAPVGGPLGGEIQANTTTDGQQRYPDVAMNLDGDTFVITWQSSIQDGSGWGVYSRLFHRSKNVQESNIVTIPSTDVPRGIPDPGTVISTLSVTENAFIRDLNVHLDITHPRPADLEVYLVGPDGTRVLLFRDVPRPVNGQRPAGENFIGTVLDDGAQIAITDSANGATPPFSGSWVPEQRLNVFNGKNARGTWQLVVTDRRAGPPGNERQAIERWSIEIEKDPALTGEIPVNTTVLGDQFFPSTAMAHDGSFVVTWSGRGTQSGQEDDMGVYYQRFDARGVRVLNETRVNNAVAGNQYMSSVGMDGEGNFVIAWTGVGSSPGTTDVYKYVSAATGPVKDFDGPIVTDVLDTDWNRLLDGDVVQPPLPGMTQIIVVFDENLNTRNVPTDLHNVTNPHNWTLERNGTQIVGAIQSVTFARNPISRKYEALLTFDGNGLDSLVSPLGSGDYVLTVSDTIWDVADNYDATTGQFIGNALDGDFDGNAGTRPTGSGYAGFKFHFTVVATPQLGAEFRVNEAKTFEDSLGASLSRYGVDYAREESTRSVAIDHDGDFAVVWTRYGADGDSNPNSPDFDPNAATNGGIYLRLFRPKRVGDDPTAPEFIPLTGDVLVNQYTKGNQRNAAVAMDADGDLIVVWESEGEDPDGSKGIFARRFSAIGEPLGPEFRVHSNTPNDQFNPSVACDPSGNFVVVWASAGQPFSYFNDIRAQRFDYQGQRLGSEFRVNQQNIPGSGITPGGSEVNPTVAMSYTGAFVVAWDQNVVQANGVTTNTNIVFRLYDPQGVALTNDTRANAGTEDFTSDPTHDPKEAAMVPGSDDIHRTARNPQASMDAAGNFIIAWEAFQDNDVDALAGPESYGIYFRRFNYQVGTGATATYGVPEMANDHQANLTITDTRDDAQFPGAGSNSDKFGYDQMNPTIAMDVDGDYAIAWDGQGAETHPLYPNNPQYVSDIDNQGVFVRNFHAQDPRDDVPEYVSVQSRVNRTSAGSQKYPSLAMEPDGDKIVVWSGNGVGDPYGIFARYYDETTDTAGPMVTDFLLADGESLNVNSQLTEALGFLVVSFDEEMMTTGPDGVLNAANFHLLKDGVEQSGAIGKVVFGLNKAYELGLSAQPSNKWEAVLYLDGDGATPGTTLLGDGQYTISVRNNLRDKAGNPLRQTGLNPNGESYSRSFNIAVAAAQGETLVNTTTAGMQRTSTDGSQTVATDADGGQITVWTTDGKGVFARLHRNVWTEGANNTRNDSYQAITDLEFQVTNHASATSASVAADDDGDFVVTWAQDDGGTSSWNVYARRYDAKGNPLSAPFLVNSYTDNIQSQPTVAMDLDGDFVIAWQSFNQDGSGYGVYAQRYSPAGNPMGGANEVQVLSFVNQPAQATFTLRYDNGTTTQTTAAIQYKGNLEATAADIKAKLEKIGAEVEVEAIDQMSLAIRFVDQSGSKNQKPLTLVVASITAGADLTIRTTRDGSAGEFLVNETTLHNQMYPSAAMSSQGDIVVSWTSYGQDGDAATESNIYAKVLSRNSVVHGNTGLPDYDSLTRGTTELPTAIEPFIVSSDSPDNHLVTAGIGFDGVCRVEASEGGEPAWFGSGSLLSTGRHVLTAAHVVTDELFGDAIQPDQLTVYFDTPNGRVAIPAKQVFVHPLYTGTMNYSYLEGDDIAVIELEYAAPASIPRYDLYRSRDEVGQVFDMYGYGTTGRGDTGAFYWDDKLRHGQNRFDALGDIEGFSEALLVFDFDSGYAADDTLGRLFGITDLGMGLFETGTAGGDSGGPSFLDGKIVSIHTAGSVYEGWGALGFDTRVSVHADWLDDILSATSEFLVSTPTTAQGGAVSTTTAGNQKWSSVAMDADGDFVVTWTSYGQDGVGNGYGAGVNGENGVYARRFRGNGGGALGAEFQVNTYATDDQQRSRVAMDADGDFVVAWESYQDSPIATDSNSFGIYGQRFVSSELLAENPTNPQFGANGRIGGEFRVNSTVGGDQRYPGVAMDDTGDFVVVWSGNGAGNGVSDTQGVFSQWYNKATDDAGPTVTAVYDLATTTNGVRLYQVLEGLVLDRTVTEMVVNFGEDLNVAGGMNGRNSVLNPTNWQLTKDGDVLQGGVGISKFWYNAATNKYEARLVLDSDPSKAGLQPLDQGEYVLTLRDEVWDLFDNALDGNLDGAPGGDCALTFSVYTGLNGIGGPGGPGTPSTEDEDHPINSTLRDDQANPAIASNAAGDYVVVWTTNAAISGGTTLESNVIAQRFDRYGRPLGEEIIVNDYMAGDQKEPDVAMDDFGNFVVVWSGMGDGDTTGIWARRFDVWGQPLDEDAFGVNNYVKNTQSAPSVAMDADGDFIVSWTSYGQDGDKDGVFARRYDFLGRPQENNGEFQVNTASANRQRTSDIAVDDNGNFTVVWMSEAQDGSAWGVYGQRFTAAGQRLGSEFRVNQYTNDKQVDPQIAMDADGDFVVAWSSYGQDGSGYGVYARRYSKVGQAQGNEFLVNQNTTNWQHQPAVSMADNGKFVVTWTTFNQDNIPEQDNRDHSVYARMYDANGVAQNNEWRVNATRLGNQNSSAVAMDADGDFTAVWVGPDDFGTGIFQRVVGVNTGSYQATFIAAGYGYDVGAGLAYAAPTSLVLTGTAGNDTFEFVAGPSRGAWIVKLNGVTQNVTSYITSIRFNGLGGSDTVKITGSDADESVELWPRRLTFTGSDYLINATNIEVAVINGLGGEDQATLWDSAGNDVFTAKPTAVTQTGPGYSQTLNNFEQTYAHASLGGADVASFYGSAGDDTFVGTPEYGKLSGDNYFFWAKGFDSVYAYAAAGGNDTATLKDSAGSDALNATPAYTALSGTGYYLRAKGFASVNAYGTAGGVDVAKFSDSTGNDVFDAKPKESQMQGSGYRNWAYGFERITALASSGYDVANLYDSAKDDTFSLWSTRVVVTGGASYQTGKFDVVNAFATAGGSDVAHLYDSAGDDHMVGTPTETILSGARFRNTATGFDYVHGYASSGMDTADLYDSTGDDTFVGRPDYGKLTGTGYLLRAKGFDYVHAYAKFGGNDMAMLFGSSQSDQFSHDGTAGILSGANYSNEANGFEKVQASGAGGTDVANLSNANVQQNTTGQPTGITANYVAWMAQFEELQVKKTPSSSPTTVNAVDKIFDAFWS